MVSIVVPSLLHHAMPPEVNTSRLMVGAGPAPMLQAAAGWEALALLLETQADELMSSLAALSSSWSGAASERAVQATMPLVAWLRSTAMQAQKRALQASAQATSYTAALGTTPPLPEIEQNHITNATLNATNFLGVNTVPIGLNEADYIRMWNQAAGVMDAYQAETMANTVFEPILPVKPVVIPGVGESAAGTASAQLAALAPGALVREMSIATVSTRAKLESVALTAGRGASMGNQAGSTAQSQAQKAESTAHKGQPAQQGMQMAMQVGSQVGSMAMQLPQQGMQMVTQPLQQLTGPLQQLTSMFSSMGNAQPAQIGMIGASPFSNHPLAGGSGLGSGAGLVRAASLPGMGGSMAQTPLMANLVGNSEKVPVGAGAGSGGAGLAPVNSGAGGGAPMGHAAKGKKGEANKQGLQAPSVLPQDLSEDEGDDW